MTTWDVQTARARLRLGSGLVMLAFVTMHMVAHVALLISFEWADTALAFLMAPWRTMPGTVILAAAFLVHYAQRAVVDLCPAQPADAAMGAVAAPARLRHSVSDCAPRHGYPRASNWRRTSPHPMPRSC